MIDCRYFEPATMAEACSLLAEYGQGGRIVAGGQDLSLLLRCGKIEPAALISIHKVAGLDAITTVDVGIRIGAMVRLQRLSSGAEPVVQVLSAAVPQIADRQIRNRATLGGSICAAHPGSDINTILLTLDAALTLVSNDGERVVGVEDFLLDAFSTAAQPGELLREVVLPVPEQTRSAAAYRRFALRDGDYPVVGAGVFIGLDNEGLCCEPRIVLGNCRSTPIRASKAEQRLQGCDLAADDAAVGEAVSLAAAHIEPLSEPMASGEYKKELIVALTREVLMEVRGQVLVG